jgi:hypothetical protein
MSLPDDASTLTLEMISRDAYGAINGALVAPMNVTLAVAPLAAAWIWSATGGTMRC